MPESAVPRSPGVDGPDVADRVRTTLPRLTGALRHVAETVLAEPAAVAELSTAALAERAGVSQASVTRFAQAIGLASHQQLRIALATQLGRAAVPGWSTDLGPVIAADDPVGRVATVVANADIRAINQTVDQLDLEALDRAAHALAAARRIDVYGVGGSSTIAAELEMRLFRIGVQVRAWPEVHGAATSAALLTEADAVVAISHSGATAEVLEPVELAQDRGATTIGITSDPRSPLAVLADEVLTTAVLETSFRSGGLAARHSQLVVTDCLYIRVAQLTSTRAGEAIDLTEEISTKHSVRPRRPRGDRR
ncbi:MurR/RpiR family transcriptional regulator [Kribbella amoyensis]|uniref:MurR/RpiR family transcriptional regulator n=1 Tax=Kribbella amoyensis TaxID=996641 RepID=UPI00192D32E0|nr:MurR/RpiR family transcriptional regulator [Kribbella amoyensis]